MPNTAGTTMPPTTWSQKGRSKKGGGSFILIGHEIMNNEPKAHLPEPQSGLVFATTLFGGILGGLGAHWRKRQERRVEAASVR